jgi:MFS family permease
MCAACGVSTHIPDDDLMPQGQAGAGMSGVPAGGMSEVGTARPAKFAALRNPNCRVYLVGGMLSMMADNIEHVITYWVLWEKFHSPALTGFEVISHWLPFLLLSPYFGALADRHDCRKLIQGAQALFMAVSASWGILFITGELRVWNACALLILHGTAGAIWGPSEQLMLEDFVGPAELPSAIRLNSTARSLGVLLGPVVGSALLLGLGPTGGIFANMAIYLPLTILMARTKYTGHLRAGIVAKTRVGALSALKVLREVGRDRVLVSMIVLAGLGAFFVGSAMQSAMPAIADSMGGISSTTAYSVLLFANGLGGVLGGILLEGTGKIKLSVRAAVWSTALYGATSAAFAFTHQYLIASLLLVVGGIANLAALSITQTVVQLLAPREKRGQVVGVFGMSANGLRIGSGFTVGLLGTALGLRASLGISSIALCACTALVALYLAIAARRPADAGGLVLADAAMEADERSTAAGA